MPSPNAPFFRTTLQTHTFDEPFYAIDQPTVLILEQWGLREHVDEPHTSNEDQASRRVITRCQYAANQRSILQTHIFDEPFYAIDQPTVLILEQWGLREHVDEPHTSNEDQASRRVVTRCQYAANQRSILQTHIFDEPFYAIDQPTNELTTSNNPKRCAISVLILDPWGLQRTSMNLIHRRRIGCRAGWLLVDMPSPNAPFFRPTLQTHNFDEPFYAIDHPTDELTTSKKPTRCATSVLILDQ